MVDFLVKYGSVLGLLLSLIGVIIIAVVQNRLFNVVRAWLNSLDFTARPETPAVMFPGWDKVMEKAVRQNRWLSWIGWILIVVGVTLQLCTALPSAFRGHCR